jgi:hypothetical protein
MSNQGVSDSFLSFFTSQNKKTQEFNNSILSKLDSISSSISSFPSFSKDLQELKMSSKEIKDELIDLQTSSTTFTRDGKVVAPNVDKDIKEVKRDLKKVMDGTYSLEKKVDEIGNEIRDIKELVSKITTLLSSAGSNPILSPAPPGERFSTTINQIGGGEEIPAISDLNVSVPQSGNLVIKDLNEIPPVEIPPTVEGKPNILIDIGTESPKILEFRMVRINLFVSPMSHFLIKK